MNITVSVQRPVQHKEIDTRWTQIKISKPFINRSACASTIQAGDIYIHGGCNRQQGILSDFYTSKIDDLPAKWTLIKQKGQIPGQLRNHSMFSYLSFIIIYGGQKSMMETNNKIFAFDLRTADWRQCECLLTNGDKKQLPALDSHTVITQGSEAYVMFGYDASIADYSTKIIRLDLKNVHQNKVKWEQIATVEEESKKTPIPRTCSAGIIFKQDIYIFGGGGRYGTLDDMWVFNVENKTWEQIVPQSQNKYWPSKRKGHSMVFHNASGNFFMFGGLKQITKEQNDVCIFLRQRNKWVQIHSNTNELYDPSPTIKKQIEDSPTILQAKRKRSPKKQGGFRLSIKSTTSYGQMKRASSTSTNINKFGNDPKKRQVTMKTELGNYDAFKNMSVVQQRKYRQFLVRKKKLLSQISKGQIQSKRDRSPTSEALVFSLNSIGQQQNVEKQQSSFQVPKVIFDQEKGVVIGKKPCARDGHIGLANENQMIVIGGDRHMVSFNDCYVFKMDKAIHSVHRYL